MGKKKDKKKGKKDRSNGATTSETNAYPLVMTVQPKLAAKIQKLIDKHGVEEFYHAANAVIANEIWGDVEIETKPVVEATD